MRPKSCASLVGGMVTAIVLGLAPPALGGIPPVRAVDPSHVEVITGHSVRANSAVNYSNTLAPLFAPPVSPADVNLAGDDIVLSNVGTACSVQDMLDETLFGIRYGANCPSTCDLYVLFFDDVNPGSTSPPVFDNFIGGFYLNDAATTAGADVFYNVTGLVGMGIGFPIPDNNLGVIVIVSQPGSMGTPVLPVADASVLAAGSTPNAASGSGPDIGSSTSTIWCDTSGNMDIEANEAYSWASPNLGNLYLRLTLVRPCPACTNAPVAFPYLVVGNANGTPWSWRIESPSGEFVAIEEPSAPGTLVSTLAVTQSFATSINFGAIGIGCVNNQITATATPLLGGNALLTIWATAVNPIDLYVGAANTAPGCLVTSLPACSFNPTIRSVVLSGTDCNGNDQDDGIDIAAGLSADANSDGIPDECQCPSDFDHSGYVDIDDFSSFVAAFEAGTDNADFDQSGFVDTDDYDEFVRAFESGC